MSTTTTSSGAAGCKTAKFTAAANTYGPYHIIDADPAWSYDRTGRKGSAANHYPTMSLEDIKALPVADLAAKDCALFIWATAPLLPEALSVIEAWGFTYKTVAFTWVKRNKVSPTWFFGLGHWTRQNAEYCLLATRGRPERVSKSVHSVLDDPIGRHSEKPQSHRDRIVELMGDVPRLEMFARTATPGWDVWGNQVASNVHIPAPKPARATQKVAARSRRTAKTSGLAVAP